MIDPVKTASERFAQGFSCSQAIFSAFASRFGLSDDLALKLSSPFGGGIARHGQVCGALTGALMVLGLQKGNVIPEDKENTYRIAGEFVRLFKERHGSILCNELIGYDISTSAGLQTAREKNLFTTICPALVKETTELLAEICIK